MSMKLLYPRERCFLSCSCTNGTAETASVSNDGLRQCILCLFAHCFDKWIYLQAFEYSLKIIKARVSDQDPKVKSVSSFFFSPGYGSCLRVRVLDQHSLVAVGLLTTFHFLARVRKLKPRGICCLLPQGGWGCKPVLFSCVLSYFRREYLLFPSWSWTCMSAGKLHKNTSRL